MIVDSKETYRIEFEITGVDGVFTVKLAGMAVATGSSPQACKDAIDADYPKGEL